MIALHLHQLPGTDLPGTTDKEMPKQRSTGWRSSDMIHYLSTRRGIYYATLVLVGFFVLASGYRAFPYVDDVNVMNSLGDDWLTYKLNALSILRHGLTITRIPGNYHLPGGFLYNYFVAAVFVVSGTNSTHVYLIQAILLALSVGTATLAFKPFLNDKGVAIYFLSLALIAFIDVFCFYSFRLLSENLLLFLLPVFYLLFLSAMSKASLARACGAGVMLGLCALCRQNVILLGPILAGLSFVYLQNRPRRALFTLLFLISFCVVFAILPLRNYAVTGELSVPVIRYTTQRVESSLAINSLTPRSILSGTAKAFLYFLKRILFCAGITTTLNLPAYYLKPHWLVIWIGAFGYGAHVVKRKRVEFWEAFAIIFVIAYLAPLIALADVSNYGVRMIVAVMPVVMVLCAAWLSLGSNNGPVSDPKARIASDYD